MIETNPAVDAWVARAKAWRDEIGRLRAILLASGMTEEFKWRGGRGISDTRIGGHSAS